MIIFQYIIMLNIKACISKNCLQTYIFIIIDVNIAERYITKNMKTHQINAEEIWIVTTWESFLSRPI